MKKGRDVGSSQFDGIGGHHERWMQAAREIPGMASQIRAIDALFNRFAELDAAIAKEQRALHELQESDAGTTPRRKLEHEAAAIEKRIEALQEKRAENPEVGDRIGELVNVLRACGFSDLVQVINEHLVSAGTKGKKGRRKGGNGRRG